MAGSNVGKVGADTAGEGMTADEFFDWIEGSPSRMNS